MKWLQVYRCTQWLESTIQNCLWGSFCCNDIIPCMSHYYHMYNLWHNVQHVNITVTFVHTYVTLVWQVPSNSSVIVSTVMPWVHIHTWHHLTSLICLLACMVTHLRKVCKFPQYKFYRENTKCYMYTVKTLSKWSVSTRKNINVVFAF